MTANGDGLSNAGISPRERLERIENMLTKIDEKLDSKADISRVVVLEQFMIESRGRNPERLIAELREAQSHIRTLESEHQVMRRRIAYYSGAAAVIAFIGREIWTQAGPI